MKLFYSPASPFARKVRVAAIELGLADRLELEIADLAPGKPNRAYAESFNPLRKLPTLLADDGTRLFDSTVICEYFDALAGGGTILPRDPSERWRVLTHHALEQGRTEAAILFRYETTFRPEQYRWPLWIKDQCDRNEGGMKWFNENSDELAEPLNLTHFALGSLLGYIEFR